VEISEGVDDMRELTNPEIDIVCRYLGHLLTKELHELLPDVKVAEVYDVEGGLMEGVRYGNEVHERGIFLKRIRGLEGELVLSVRPIHTCPEEGNPMREKSIVAYERVERLLLELGGKRTGDNVNSNFFCFSMPKEALPIVPEKAL